MRFQIQLLSERQQQVRIESTTVNVEGTPRFDSVSINDSQSPHCPGVTLLVPLGRSEALAEALRRAVA